MKADMKMKKLRSPRKEGTTSTSPAMVDGNGSLTFGRKGKEGVFDMTQTESTEQNHEYMEKINPNERHNQQKAVEFDTFLRDSGIKPSFELIFAEIVSKKVPRELMIPYAQERLMQMAVEIRQL